MGKMRKIYAAAIVAIGLGLGLGFGLSGGGAGLPSGVVFQATFDSGTVQSAFSNTAQCGNIGGQTTYHTNVHYFGDLYSDTGGSSSSTRGSLFNLAGAHLVPPGQGSGSARFVIPVTPSGYGRSGCTLIPAAGSVLRNTTSDLGQTKWYGIMVYAPPGETIGTADAQGAILWEYHFNAVSGNSFSIGLVPRGGTGGWSVTDSVESGACAFGSSTVPVTGCLYRSHPTSCSTFHPIEFGVPVTCIQGPLYTIPPGALKTGGWYDIAVGIKWATDKSGSITTEWRQKGSPTWTQGWSGSGFPTVQWNAAKYGNSPTCPTGVACGYPNYEPVESYSAHEVGHAYSFNIDDVIVGTSRSAVEGLLP